MFAIRERLYAHPVVPMKCGTVQIFRNNIDE